ncbi:MAG TPA: hypothetical protein VLC54_13810, partial [Anaeromyxobacter sp.]|nr:hypothetical protein [Anaeromyxobacter sp.]
MMHGRRHTRVSARFVSSGEPVTGYLESSAPRRVAKTFLALERTVASQHTSASPRTEVQALGRLG